MVLLSKFIIVSINSSSSSLQKYKFLEIIVFLETQTTNKRKKKQQEERKISSKGEEKNIQRSHELRDNSLSSIEIHRPNREIFNASVSVNHPPLPLERIHGEFALFVLPLSNADDISSMAEESERASDIFRHLLYHRPLPPPTKIFLAWFWMRHRSRGGGGSAAFVAGRYPLSTGPLL